MTTHIMVDLEMLSLKSNPIIPAIGAVVLNEQEGTLGERFFQTIDIESYEEHNLDAVADMGTIKWWLKQNDSVRAQASSDASSDVKDALHSFCGWVRHQRHKGDGNLTLWGNGAATDNVALRNLYEACDIEAPWTFREDGCYRTVKNRYPHIDGGERKGLHIAIDDAVWQAQHLLKIMKEANF